jgi:hypothetical protein
MMGEVQPPSERAPSRKIPPDLEELAMRCLEAEPRDRPHSVIEIIVGIKDHITGAGKRRESETLVSEVAARFESEEHTYPVLCAVQLCARTRGGLVAGEPKSRASSRPHPASLRAPRIAEWGHQSRATFLRDDFLTHDCSDDPCRGCCRRSAHRPHRTAAKDTRGFDHCSVGDHFFARRWRGQARDRGAGSAHGTRGLARWRRVVHELHAS